MIRILSIGEEPIHVVPYKYPRTGGGVQVGEFPVYLAVAEGLPAGLDGLLVMSDLQGVEHRNDDSIPPRLLGHVLAEEVYLLLDSETLPMSAKTGIILAGDLHVAADLEKRGGKGDVREVWLAFSSYFPWVVGVAGNHDRFGNCAQDLEEFAALNRIYYLDGSTTSVFYMIVGGLGGIIGNPRKPFRREENEYLNLVNSIIKQKPDIVVLHESPAIEEMSYPGSPSLRKCLQVLPPTLVLSGHCHWKHPGLVNLRNGTQVLNVEGRAVLLCRDMKQD